ncbi:MAG: hypothetical protein RRZ38_07965, partial [Hafnia sp.]
FGSAFCYLGFGSTHHELFISPTFSPYSTPYFLPDFLVFFLFLVLLSALQHSGNNFVFFLWQTVGKLAA